MIDFLLGFLLGGGEEEKEVRRSPRQRAAQIAISVILLALVAAFLLFGDK